MESLETWVLLVDGQFQVTGNTFPIPTSSNDNIHTLTVKVKQLCEALAHVDAMMLTVWRFSDNAPTFEFKDLHSQQRLVSEAFSKNQVILVRKHWKIANLHLSEEEVLLVQVPSTSCIYTVVSSFS